MKKGINGDKTLRFVRMRSGRHRIFLSPSSSFFYNNKFLNIVVKIITSTMQSIK